MSVSFPVLSSLPSLPPFATDAQVNLKLPAQNRFSAGSMRESCIRASLSLLDRHHEDAEVREDVLHAIPTADSLIYRFLGVRAARSIYCFLILGRTVFCRPEPADQRTV